MGMNNMCFLNIGLFKNIATYASYIFYCICQTDFTVASIKFYKISPPPYVEAIAKKPGP